MANASLLSQICNKNICASCRCCSQTTELSSQNTDLTWPSGKVEHMFWECSLCWVAAGRIPLSRAECTWCLLLPGQETLSLACYLPVSWFLFCFPLQQWDKPKDQEYVRGYTVTALGGWWSLSWALLEVVLPQNRGDGAGASCWVP